MTQDRLMRPPFMDSFHPERSHAGKQSLKSPFYKGGFRGIFRELLKSPLAPLFQRGVFEGVSGWELAKNPAAR
jgi:hypothetical protein